MVLNSKGPLTIPADPRARHRRDHGAAAV